MTVETFFEKFELFAEMPNAIGKMRELILAMAVQGGLADPCDDDAPVNDLIKQLHQAKNANGSVKAAKPTSTAEAELPFQLPGHWALVRLCDIGMISGGHTPSKNNARYWNGDVQWFTSKDIKRDELYESELKITAAAADSPGLQLYPPGCLFMVARSGILKRTFPVAINRIPATANQDLKVLRPFVPGLERYLQIMFRGLTPFILSELVKTGMTVQSLKYDEFATQPFPLPPLAEQKRIVAKVDELMGLCDRLETQQDEREAKFAHVARAALARFTKAPTPANLNFLFHSSYNIDPADIRKAILTLAVSGKLVRQDTSDEPADRRVLRPLSRTSAGTREHDSVQPIGQKSVPFHPPLGWVWVQAQDLCCRGELITYGILKPVWVESGVPTVRVQDMQEGRITLEGIGRCLPERAAKFAKTTLKAGDLLIAKDGATLGKTAFVPPSLAGGNITQHVLRFPVTSQVDRSYVRLVIDSPHGQAWMIGETKGVALPGVNVGDFRRMPIPLPPLREQRRIVAKVDQLMAVVDRLEAHLSESRTVAERLMEAVLKELTRCSENSRSLQPVEV